MSELAKPPIVAVVHCFDAESKTVAHVVVRADGSVVTYGSTEAAAPYVAALEGLSLP